DQVVVAVDVAEVGQPELVGVDRRRRVGAGFDRVGDRVTVAVEVAIVGDAVEVGADALVHCVGDAVVVAVEIAVVGGPVPVGVAGGNDGHDHRVVFVGDAVVVAVVVGGLGRQRAPLDPVGDAVGVGVGVEVVGGSVPVGVLRGG